MQPLGDHAQNGFHREREAPPPVVFGLEEVPTEQVVESGPRPRWWLHALLLALTLLTTTTIGARMSYEFWANQPALTDDQFGFIELWSRPSLLAAGLPYSLTLLAILMAHELGHYIACVFYRVDATPPYFLPAPTLIGTLGAFIKIRSPIYSRTVLFDVGIAGPLAGFVVLAPALVIGIAYSKVIPGISAEGDVLFGVPLLQKAIAAWLFPGVPSTDLYLHPVARAAWAGMLATALNLLPIGQLDGGHILYSFIGEWHRILSRIFVALLVPLALIFSYYGWLLWAALLFFFGLRHPVIYDVTVLSPKRRLLGVLALIIFVLCFTATPVKMGDLIE